MEGGRSLTQHRRKNKIEGCEGQSSDNFLYLFRIVQEAESRAREAERENEALKTEKAALKREKEAAVEEIEQERAAVREMDREREAAVREMEREREAAVERVREMEQEREAAEGRLRESAEREKQVLRRGKEIAEERARQLETQWVVEGWEIQLTQQELGRGGWATVCVAEFRGARVAAKCIHGEIASDYNIQLFQREMNVAARIRHPNLLQFIGATLEGEMVILTELMPTSLRNELRKQPMTPDQATGISLDVARALNYLHQMQPDAFVHRDISSANVLLEPLPGGRWRAKVSDYGSVNLQEMLQTAYPGNPCYSAPEAGVPSQQSPKMDIFSFGVLLLEMLSGKFPDPKQRECHLLMQFATIQCCLSSRAA